MPHRLLGHERLIVFGAGLVVIALLELVEPRIRLSQPRRIRWTANLGFAIGNAVAIRTMIGGLFLTWVAWIDDHRHGLLGSVALPTWLDIAIAVLLLDLAFYSFHRWLMHAWPFGWRFHLVHHTDLDLDVTSASRFHLGELALSMLYTAIVVGVFGPSLIGVVVYEAAKLLAAQFNHSNWRLPPRFEHWLGYLVVTPAIHWVHHSQEPHETNSNYANIFSFWDRWFGTYQGEDRERQLVLGLKEHRDGHRLRLHEIFLLPFRHL